MLFALFVTFFKVGLFTFGGGYAMLPVIQKEVVERKGWLTAEEFIDSIAITNSLPGALAINCATFVGGKKAGFWGAFCASLGAVIPSFVVILCVAFSFKTLQKSSWVQHVFAGIRPAVAVLILMAVAKLSRPVGLRWANLGIALFVLIAVLCGIHPVLVLSLSGAAGFFIFRNRNPQERA